MNIPENETYNSLCSFDRVLAANTMGSAMVFGQELLFREQLFKYKFSYWESEYSKIQTDIMAKLP